MTDAMRLLAVCDIETDNGEYNVELFDIAAFVSVYKKRNNGLVYKQKIKHGSARFRDAIKALIRRSEPGSPAREHLSQCDCAIVKKLMTKAA